MLSDQDIQCSRREMGLTFLNKIMATENNLQNYELMAIFTPVLSEEDYKGAQKKFADFVKENGGSVTHSDAWGLRSLSYPIAKKNNRHVLRNGIHGAWRYQR